MRRFWFFLVTMVVLMLVALHGSVFADSETEAAWKKIWTGPWPREAIVTDYVLVKFYSPEKGEAMLKQMGVSLPSAQALPAGWYSVDVKAAAKGLGIQTAATPTLEDVRNVALALAKQPNVERVAFDYRLQFIGPEEKKVTLSEGQKGPSAQAIPTDPLYWLQWHFTDATTTPTGGANAEAAWDITVGGPSTVVAVLDTGVTPGPDGFKHPFFQECNTVGAGWVCASGVQTDGNGHGTHVAGTIAQESSLVTPGDDGVAGIAPNVTLFPIKVLSDSGSGTFTDVAEGITLAAQNGADVINMSLGADCGTWTWMQGCFHPTVDAAIEDAVLNYDVLIVASAGNASDPVPGYPANHPLVMAIAASDQNSLSYYSSYGPGLSVSAPGGNYFEDVDGDTLPDLIWQETHDGSFSYSIFGFQGTSMAAPHVTGAAALLRSWNTAATWQQVRACIESTALDGAFADDPALGYDFRYGYGLLDIAAALSCIQTPPTTFAVDAYSPQADTGISTSMPANFTEIHDVYLSEIGGGGDLTWNAYTSTSADCSTNDAVPWITMAVTSGTIPAYATDQFSVTLDAGAAGVGTHTAYICIANNDPDPGPGNKTNLIPIPVMLQVTAPISVGNELVCNGPAINFEAGIPTTWSVTDDAGTGVVWDVTGAGTCVGDDNYTNGSGLAACVNSDRVGFADYDTSLITNPVTIPATASSATLSFSMNFQVYEADNVEYLDLDVSTDGGATWTTLISWDTDQGSWYSPPGVDVNVDLSSYIGQTIQLRWRYYAPNTSPDWDWYAQIDDVTLDCADVPPVQPNIDVTPTSLSATLDPNQNTNLGLSIANTGEAILYWSFSEEDLGFTPLISDEVRAQANCATLANVAWLSVSPVSGSTDPNAVSNVTVNVDATGLTPGTYSANLCLYSNDPDPGPGNGTGLVVVPVTLSVRGVDLQVTKSVDNASPLLGENVTFTITVSEVKGVYGAPGVQVTDVLPAGLSYVSHTATQGTYDPLTGVWDVGTIPAGGSATLEITAQVTALGSMVNTATITATDLTDTNNANDSASVTINPQPAVDLEVQITADKSHPSPGDPVTFTVTVRNLTPAVDATGVQLSVFLADGFQYQSHAVSQGTTVVTFHSTDITWNVGTIPAGGSATLTVETIILEKPEDWTVEAQVTAVTELDRDLTNNSDQLLLRPSLPATGFAPGQVLPEKPANLHFADMGMTIEIPRLGLRTEIVGVPSGSTEAVAWLGQKVGHLQSTTIPTWLGNAVLTAHSTLATGEPGPFAHLDQLRWGDVIRIYYLGQVYEYEVRRVAKVSPTTFWPLKPIQDGYSWLTLITCADFDAASNAYHSRLVVRAVLMRVYPAH